MINIRYILSSYFVSGFVSWIMAIVLSIIYALHELSANQIEQMTSQNVIKVS